MAPTWQEVHELVNTVIKEALLGQVIVINDLPAGMKIRADPMIVTVFYNLMDNAVRYGDYIHLVQYAGIRGPSYHHR